MSRFFDHDLNVNDTLESIRKEGKQRDVHSFLLKVITEECLNAHLLRDLRIQAARKRNRKRKGSLMKKVDVLKNPFYVTEAFTSGGMI